jgi:hypothetical protein
MERAELMPIANKYLPPSPSTKLGQQQRTRVTTIGSGRVSVIQKAKWIRQKKIYWFNNSIQCRFKIPSIFSFRNITFSPLPLKPIYSFQSHLTVYTLQQDLKDCHPTSCLTQPLDVKNQIWDKNHAAKAPPQHKLYNRPTTKLRHEPREKLWQNCQPSNTSNYP